tara:strand:- start:8158 stop:8868 length:711 start_codon:yes stop_codon:yes gene_type:complete
MAVFKFNITDSTFKVEQLPDVVTDCATIFNFKVSATAGNDIRISLDNTYTDFNNSFYTILGVETPWDGTDVTVVYGSDLYFSFSLGNSGTPGTFFKTIVEVWDDTTVDPYNFYTLTVTRLDDNLPCDDPTGQGGTYDELTDTPGNKVGQSLKLVRVSLDETVHEYVDPGTLGNDLNYTHVQASSASWVIAHSLGKIPSVMVQDGSGNRVHGDITYTDLNNLTITFNTAFAGTAYLN